VPYDRDPLHFAAPVLPHRVEDFEVCPWRVPAVLPLTQEQGALTDDDPIREDFTQDRDDEPVSDSGALHAAR